MKGNLPRETLLSLCGGAALGIISTLKEYQGNREDFVEIALFVAVTALAIDVPEDQDPKNLEDFFKRLANGLVERRFANLPTLGNA
jgi:hypothetical protein